MLSYTDLLRGHFQRLVRSTQCTATLMALSIALAWPMSTALAGTLSFSPTLSEVTVGTSFTLTVSSTVPGFSLSSAFEAAATFSTSSAELVSALAEGSNEVELRLRRAPDNAVVTLMLSDQGDSGSIQLIARVVASELGVSAEDVRIDQEIAGNNQLITVVGVDAQGNVDVDWEGLLAAGMTFTVEREVLTQDKFTALVGDETETIDALNILTDQTTSYSLTVQHFSGIDAMTSAGERLDIGDGARIRLIVNQQNMQGLTELSGETEVALNYVGNRLHSAAGPMIEYYRGPSATIYELYATFAPAAGGGDVRIDYDYIPGVDTFQLVFTGREAGEGTPTIVVESVTPTNSSRPWLYQLHLLWTGSQQTQSFVSRDYSVSDIVGGRRLSLVSGHSTIQPTRITTSPAQRKLVLIAPPFVHLNTPFVVDVRVLTNYHLSIGDEEGIIAGFQDLSTTLSTGTVVAAVQRIDRISLTIADVAHDSTTLLTVEEAQSYHLLLESSQVELFVYEVVPTHWELNPPGRVVSGQAFAVPLSAEDDAGYAHPDFPLSSSAVITMEVATQSLPVEGCEISSAGFTNCVIRNVADGTSVVLTVSDQSLEGTATVVVDVVATVLLLSPYSTDGQPLLQEITHDQPFVLRVTAVQLETTQIDTDFNLSLATTVTATVGRVELLGRTSSSVTVKLSEVADASLTTLTLSDQGLVGSVGVQVQVQASGLLVRATSSVVSGQPFDLHVSGVDASGAVDLDYGLSSAAIVTASVGSLDEHLRTASHLSVVLSGVVEGTTVTLTVTDGALSGTATVKVGVVATHLAVSLQNGGSSVKTFETFTLEVWAEDESGSVASSYMLSSPVVTVSTATGEVLWQSYTAPELMVQLSVMKDHTTALLTVTDGVLFGALLIMDVDVVASRVEYVLESTAVRFNELYRVDIIQSDASGAFDEDATIFENREQSISIPSGAVRYPPNLDENYARYFHLLDDTLEEGTVVTLGASYQGTTGIYMGIATFTVVVEASSLRLTPPPLAVISGRAFELQISGVEITPNPHDQFVGELFEHVDLDYEISPSVRVDSSSGMVELLSNTTNTLTVSLSGAADGTAVILTVTDGALSGTAEVRVDVVATHMVVTAPAGVAAGAIFELEVLGVDATGAVDTAYMLPSTATVTASSGTLQVFLRTHNSLQLMLSGVADGTTVTLTVTDGALSGEATVLISQLVTLNLTRDEAVDIIDATLLLRGIRLTKSQRASIINEETSNIVAAGYQNLLSSEVDIVTQIDDLLSTDPPVLDLTGDNVVDIIDATLLLRGIRLTKSQRTSLMSGETSNIVVAGYANLLESETVIVSRINILLGE